MSSPLVDSFSGLHGAGSCTVKSIFDEALEGLHRDQRLLAGAIGWPPAQLQNALDDLRPLPDDIADALRLALGSMIYLSSVSVSAGSARLRPS